MTFRVYIIERGLYMAPLLIRELKMRNPLTLMKLEVSFQDKNNEVFSIKSLNENEVVVKNESGCIVLTKEQIEELNRFFYD